jgi:HEAT repeat protein
LLALLLVAPLLFFGFSVDAEHRGIASLGTYKGSAQDTPGSQGPQKKNITPVRTSDTPEGSRIVITSDGALNDYSAYRSGDRFYVVIPAAEASRFLSGLRGRGFEDLRQQKRGNDIVVSFRLLAGAVARVSQKFNRLEILVTVPALVAANNANNSNSARPLPSPTTVATPTTNSNNANTRNPLANTNTSDPNATTNSNAQTQVTPRGTGTSSQNRNYSGNPSYSSPSGIPDGTDGGFTDSGTEGFPPVATTSPSPLPSVAPSVDQVAVQTTPGPPVNITAPVTNTSAPVPTTSLGAQLRQNWLFVLLGVAVVGLIAWVLISRSRAGDVVEAPPTTLRESRSEAFPTSSRRETAVPPYLASAVLAKEALAEKEAEKEEAKPEEAKAVEVEPVVTEPPPITPVVTPIEDIAPAPAEELAEEEPVEKEIEPVVVAEPVAPAAPVAVDQASAEVRSLLEGQEFDPAVFATQDVAARQIITAELLGALAGRNTVRHERARDVFIEHGYFDDATRTLRTAESPGERASAARSLGLVRDQSATPHLIAALEDSSPEVRRAAVESLAEIRDPASVSALEALRDREKNRRIPKALIQHAIEASVVGRMKAVPTSPVASPLATTPLIEPSAPATTPLISHVDVVDEAAAPVVEAALPVSVEEPAEPPGDVTAETEPVTPLTADAGLAEATVEALPLALETEVAPEPATVADEAIEEVAPPVQTARTEVEDLPAVEVAVEEPEPIQLVETETVAEEPEAAALPPVPVETPAPVPTAEPVIEYNDGSASGWVDVDVTSAGGPVAPPVTETDASMSAAEQQEIATPLVPPVILPERGIDVAHESKDIDIAHESKDIEVAKSDWSRPLAKEIEAVGKDEEGGIPATVLRRLASEDASERSAAVTDLGRIGGDDAFREISASFDDPSVDVRNSAARALFDFSPARADSFTRALREAPPERRRSIGTALASSGLATEAIGHLMGESREKTYDAFSLLFLMSKAGELQPLMRAVEEHPNTEVRLAVVKLLALSGQQEILPAFRRLAVRGSLPTEVRSAVMEAIYQISSQTPDAASRT